MIQKSLLVSDGCFVLKVIPYCINLRYSPKVLFLDIYMRILPNLWTRFNFFMWITISLRQYQLFIIASDKNQFI